MAKARTCDFCGDRLPADVRSNRRYCDADCRRGRAKPPQPGALEAGLVAAATEVAIAEATKEKRIGPMDAGAVAAIRVLARKIDEDQARWDVCLAYAESVPKGERPPRPPAIDNVSLPTYLNYCAALGLVPSGRKVTGPKESTGGGKLGGHLASVPKPSA